MEECTGLLVLLKSSNGTDTSDPYVQALSSGLQLKVVCCPVLSFTFINLNDIDLALHHPDDYSGLVLTSQRGINALKHITEKTGCKDVMQPWRGLSTFVVGPATYRSALKLGLNPTGEESGSAEALVPIILRAVAADSKPLLYPCGNLRLETLPSSLTSHGRSLRCLTVYETTTDAVLTDNLSAVIALYGLPDYLVFFSPSGVEYTVPVLKQLCINTDNMKMVAIGATTCASMEANGMKVYRTASRPSPEGLVTVLKQTTTSQGLVETVQQTN